MDLKVFDQGGKEVSRVKVDESLLDGKVNEKVLYQLKISYHANMRSGAASTKTRGDVSGGGVKPWRQKGTGRARVGSSRNPVWRHGGVAFGPHPRDFSRSIPKKLNIVGLKSMLNDKINSKTIKLIDRIEASEPKTKIMHDTLDKLLDSKKNTLLVVKDTTRELKLSCRNIPHVKLQDSSSVNVYQLLKYENLLITKDAFNVLLGRLSPKDTKNLEKPKKETEHKEEA